MGGILKVTRSGGYFKSYKKWGVFQKLQEVGGILKVARGGGGF